MTEPSDSATSPLSIFEGPSVEAVVEIWVGEDLAPLPRPTAASVDRARPVAASVDVGRTSLPYASVVDTRRLGSAAVGPRLLEPVTSVFAGAPTVAAHPGSLDVASLRTHVRSDTPMPSSDVGQRMCVDVSRPLEVKGQGHKVTHKKFTPYKSCIVNRQFGVGDSKYVIIFDSLLTGHVIRRMRSGRVRIFNANQWETL